MVLKTYLQIRACLGLAKQLAAHKTGSVLGLSIAASSSTIDDISAFPYMCREIPKCVCARCTRVCARWGLKTRPRGAYESLDEGPFSGSEQYLAMTDGG